MADLLDLANAAYRDYETAGVPASGPNDPVKSEIRALFAQIIATIQSAIAGLKSYSTLALAQAAPAVTGGTQVRVYDDPTPSKNGVYVNRTGAVGGYAFDTGFYNQLATVVQPLVDRAETAAASSSALYAAAKNGLSYQCTAALNGSVNAWIVTLPAGVTLNAGAQYRFTAPATPTAPVVITIAGTTADLVYDNSAPVAINAKITAGWNVEVRWDQTGGSNVFRLAYSAYDVVRLNQTVTPDLWSVLSSIVTVPYGDVTKGSGNLPAAVPRTITILGRGSSVSTDDPARQGGCPAGHVPVNLLGGGINDKFGPGVNTVVFNYSHGGHVASQGPSQWNEAMAAGVPVPDILFDCFGMNCAAVPSYNSGQVSPNYLRDFYYNELKSRLDAGVKLAIVATSPHENTDKTVYEMPGGVSMSWPYAVAAPVLPTQIVPPRLESVVTRDWTGNGIRRPGSARMAHVNTMLRDIVRRFDADPAYRGRVVLADAGWAWHRFGLEQHTMAELYGPNEIVHPIELGHEVSYDICIRKLVDAMQRGQGNKWYFRGDE